MILNRTSRIFILLGAASAFLSVGLGAFGAHALKARLSEYHLAIYQTGIDYQFYHALGLILVGLIAQHINSKAIRGSGWFMLAGTLLFSGSLYLLAITGTKWLGIITPLGGTCFLIGWATLFYSCLKAGD